MNYFVIWPDGQRFGPVDLATLQQWQIENRVDNNTILEDAKNGNRIRAELVLGQAGIPPTTTPFSQPSQTQNPYVGYPRNVSYPSSVQVANGKTELTVSYICGALGIALACCIPIVVPIIGLVLGIVAKNKGQTGAGGAIALNVVGLVISGVLFLFGMASMFTG